MTKRFIAVLTFAFVVASIASLLLYRMLANRPPSAKTQGAPARVILASRNLEVGTILKTDDLRLADWPGPLPRGASSRVQDFAGRGVLVPIYEREPVIESRLAATGAGGGLASMIPPGMRAVAVRVNDVAGVAGFATPGMRVDILVSGSLPGANGAPGTLTRTLLQNIEVLSAGQDFKKDAEGKPVLVQAVNLLVTPAQAEQLSLASAQTNIQLVLRNPLDREVAQTPGTALAQLFDRGRAFPAQPRQLVAQSAPAPAVAESDRRIDTPLPPREPAPFVMEIISGAKKTEITFPAIAEVK